MRCVGFVSLVFVLVASASFGEEKRSDVARAQAQLTQELNAQISRGVRTLEPAPPASIEDLPDAPAPPAARASS
ncbi:MAG: hypothetical protein FJ091_11440 [Deltaproteobacteria bacterium]|nr:hypothetical protein [Deltaproteobacteria bacterium]